MPMTCVVCIYTRDDGNDAVTVVNGQAVCDEHLTYIGMGEELAYVINLVQRNEERADR